MEKTCTLCNEVKSLDSFYASKSGSLGVASWCKSCWQIKNKANRAKNSAKAVDTSGPKVCATCGEEKPGAEFYRDKTKFDHLGRSCKDCTKEHRLSYYERNKEQIKARVSAYQKANPEVNARSRAKRKANGKRRLHDLKQNYGVTPEQYAEMLERAGGVCEICGRVPSEVSKKGPCVDHCHDTSKVRGILCAPCNMGIGHLRDDPDVLRKALEYLEHHSVESVI